MQVLCIGGPYDRLLVELDEAMRSLPIELGEETYNPHSGLVVGGRPHGVDGFYLWAGEFPESQFVQLEMIGSGKDDFGPCPVRPRPVIPLELK